MVAVTVPWLQVFGSLAAISLSGAVPAEPHYFTQKVTHFGADRRTFQQRYYVNNTFFKGAGSPIFVILGGEGSIPPSQGFFYPWVLDVLAPEYGGLVLEPEHRFYGTSLPFGENASFTRDNLQFMSSQQALADFAFFIRSQQQTYCQPRGQPGYCPVLTIGGSYPGFLSAMMRLRYPEVVDMAYAASAPMLFYAQDVEQYQYYDKITESAKGSAKDCPDAVHEAFDQLAAFLKNSSTEAISNYFSLCSSVPLSETVADDIFFLLEQTFANLNMANYPPNSGTALDQQCQSFIEAKSQGGDALMKAMRQLLLTDARRAVLGRHGLAMMSAGTEDDVDVDSCFDLAANLPAGEKATARCGDWSGCGHGRDGEMWDYQTCTFEVEKIGFGGAQQMFPSRDWTMEWLLKHCEERFGVVPQPTALVDLWGFTVAGLKAQSSRIVWTNGLNDGWSVGGFKEDVDATKDLIVINLPNGAHHSDLSHFTGKPITPDVQAALDRILGLVGTWLQFLGPEGTTAAVASKNATERNFVV